MCCWLRTVKWLHYQYARWCTCFFFLGLGATGDNGVIVFCIYSYRYHVVCCVSCRSCMYLKRLSLTSLPSHDLATFRFTECQPIRHIHVKTYFYASNHYLPQFYWWITYVWTICLLHWNVCFHANGPGFTKVDQIITKWNNFYSSLSGCTKFCTIGMTFMYCFGNVILYLNKSGD